MPSITGLMSLLCELVKGLWPCTNLRWRRYLVPCLPAQAHAHEGKESVTVGISCKIPLTLCNMAPILEVQGKRERGNEMASKAMGTTKQGDRIEVTVWHDPRDSYGRSVIPCAKANVGRLGLWNGWVTYESELIDTPDHAAEAQGLAASLVTFRRTA